MSDQEQNSGSAPFHQEGSAIIFDKPKSEEEVARQRREDEQHEFARTQVKTNRRLAWFTGALVLATFCSIGIGIWQASISQIAANSAKSASDTASATLKEMQTGQASQDTHTLAGQAVTQATQTTKLAISTQSLAKAADVQTRLTKESLTVVQRAFVTSDHLNISGPEASPFIRGPVWKAQTVVTNSGRTPAKNLYYVVGEAWIPKKQWKPEWKSAPTDYPDFPPLADIKNHKGMLRGVIGGETTVTNFGTEGVALSVLRDSPFANAAVYVWGAFTYGDVFDEHAFHVTEFCFFFFQPITDTAPTLDYRGCDHHNCTDAECSD